MSKFFLFATKQGRVKKTLAKEYQKIRQTGIVAIDLREGDKLLAVEPTSGNDKVLLVTANGKSIIFNEKDVRDTGRATQGVKGISLSKDDHVIGMDVITQEEEQERQLSNYELLVITENGYGKRSSLDEYSLQKRSGQGVYTAKLSKKTGNLVGMKLLRNEEQDLGKQDLLVVSEKGQTIRLPIKDVPVLGRHTQGVRIIRLAKNDKAAALALL